MAISNTARIFFHSFELVDLHFPLQLQNALTVKILLSLTADKGHIKNMKTSQSLTIFYFPIRLYLMMSHLQKNFKWSDGKKNLDIKRIQLCNATSILH